MPKLIGKKQVCKLAKVISGGQIGADLAALYAAKECGLETGGWMPHGFRRLDGLHREMKLQFGMKEHDSDEYPARTNENVFDSDATIRFAANFCTPGEVCTLKALNLHRKPFKDIHVDGNVNVPRSEIQEVVDWIKSREIKILNVAGNATNEAFDFTYKFLMRVFASLQNRHYEQDRS